MTKGLKSMKYFLALFITLFGLVSAYAETPDQQLIGLLSNIHSMRASFVQTNKDTRGQVIRRSIGTMLLLRPGKFRWDVKQPQPQQIIADGKQLWVYDPSLAQVTRHPIGKADVATSPAALLSDSLDQLAKQYEISQLNTRGYQTDLSFKLVPRSHSSMLRWVALHFTDGQLTNMRIMDNLDQLSDFSFQQIKINPDLNPALFKFLCPPGVDIVNA